MLQRGMSAEEIRMVIEASPRNSGRRKTGGGRSESH
jgi:hypothetical protein